MQDRQISRWFLASCLVHRSLQRNSFWMDFVGQKIIAMKLGIETLEQRIARDRQALLDDTDRLALAIECAGDEQGYEIDAMERVAYLTRMLYEAEPMLNWLSHYVEVTKLRLNLAGFRELLRESIQAKTLIERLQDEEIQSNLDSGAYDGYPYRKNYRAGRED